MWSPFYTGIVIGIFLGGTIGAFTMALVAAAKMMDEIRRDDNEACD